jgi:hypothetical protein
MLDKNGAMTELDFACLRAGRAVGMAISEQQLCPEEKADHFQLDRALKAIHVMRRSASVKCCGSHLSDLILNNDWIISVALSDTGRLLLGLLTAVSRPYLTATRSSGLRNIPVINNRLCPYLGCIMFWNNK